MKKIMEETRMLDFAAFYHVLFGDTNGGKIKRQGQQSQPGRVNRLLLGKFSDKDGSAEKINAQDANKLVRRTGNLSQGHLNMIVKASQADDIQADLESMLLPFFTENITKVIKDDLLDLNQSVQNVLELLRACEMDIPAPANENKEKLRFLAKVMVVSVLNSRNAMDSTPVMSLAQKGCDDWCKAASRARSAKEKAGSRKPEAYAVQTYTLASNVGTDFEVVYGRDAQINDLHEAFDRRNVVFLHGMGGIGKSALAHHYASVNHAFYHTVVFARYEKSLAALIADDQVFRMQGVFRLTTKKNVLQSDEEYAETKIQLLKQNTDEHTLIILDNFDVEEDPLFERLVQNARFRLLVTTRYEPEAGKYFSLPVKPIDDDALKNMFLHYASTAMLEQDDPGFSELFALTEKHTLTLELIAKYMAEMGITSVEEMVSLLKENHLAVLAQTEGKNRYGRISDLLRMTKLTEKEKIFLRCMTLLPLTGVHQNLFRAWCKESFSAKDRLARLSLIKLDNKAKTLSLHPVIQDVVSSEMKPEYENCRTFIERCAMVGEDCIQKMWQFPYEEKRQYFSCYGKILALIPEITEETYPLFVNVSIMANYIAPFDVAMHLHEKIYDFACAKYGKKSEHAMLVQNKRGWKCAAAGQIRQAVQYYTEAADWFLAHPECSSIEAHSCIQACGGSYYSLVFLTHDTYNVYEAETYLIESWKYGQRMLAEDGKLTEEEKHRLKYQIACNARIQLKSELEMRSYSAAEDALTWYWDAISEFAKVKGANVELDWGSWYNYQGRVRYAKKDYYSAIHAFEESRDIYVKYFGQRYTRIVEVLEALYLCYVKVGMEEEAQRYLQQAIEAAASLYTTEHPVFIRLREYQANALAVETR